MAEVVLEGVSKRYPNGVDAVRDLTLTIGDGELVVLVGPSGCGKTTTLRLLAGLEEPTAGTIRIGGRVMNGRPPRERDMAMVFQRPALYPHLTVRENLAFGLALRGGIGRWIFGSRHGAEIEVRVEQAAQMLQLGGVLDRPPDELSGGQQQRVALGRAVVRRPAAFLLDEPLSNLDARLRSEMRRELHLLHERLHATMIHVTHDQVEALTLGDRVVVLRHGLAEQVDRPLALYMRPANRFVAGFLGWPPMNFLEGELVQEDGGLSFRGRDLALPVPADLASAWQAFCGRALTLGIRPEDLRIADGATPGTLRFVATLVEPLGGSWVVTLEGGSESAGQDWQVTIPSDGNQMIRERDNVAIAFDLSRAHLFDRTTGVALFHGRREG
jgi:multiple sugar transport system ATP-binding protein